jgi:hypothetical protein
MGTRMELVAGELGEILDALGTGDRAATRDPSRFQAHVSMSGMDPTWLDLFAEAVRATVEAADPGDFLQARSELDRPEKLSEGLTVERVDRAWVSGVARVPEGRIDAVAGGWIDRLEEELEGLSGEEKPWIRELVGELVRFCRAADRSPDVVFVWALD